MVFRCSFRSNSIRVCVCVYVLTLARSLALSFAYVLEMFLAVGVWLPQHRVSTARKDFITCHRFLVVSIVSGFSIASSTKICSLPLFPLPRAGPVLIRKTQAYLATIRYFNTYLCVIITFALQVMKIMLCL